MAKSRGATLATHGKPANYKRQSSFLATRKKVKSGPKA